MMLRSRFCKLSITHHWMYSHLWEMAPHPSTLAWKISWMEEPGRLQSMGPRRVGHDWATSFHELEKEMATHSSVLAWRIPGMREPGELPSMGSHRVGHDWSDLAAAAAATHLFPRSATKISMTALTLPDTEFDRQEFEVERYKLQLIYLSFANLTKHATTCIYF